MPEPIDQIIEDLEAGFVDLVAGLRGVIRTLRDENAGLHARLDEWRQHRVAVTPALVVPELPAAETLAPEPPSPAAVMYDMDAAGCDFNARVSVLEETLIRAALQRSSGNKKAAARLLCLSRTTLLDKMRRLQLTDYGAIDAPPPVLVTKPCERCQVPTAMRPTRRFCKACQALNASERMARWHRDHTRADSRLIDEVDQRLAEYGAIQKAAV